MKIKDLTEILGADFYTGVPDSLLRALCDYLIAEYGINNRHHIIAANEGNCTAIAAGYHLATGKVPVVYMQNSGIGNIINPETSLMNDLVYGIPCIFIVGWRGEPGVHDEPQHIYQGKVTLSLLEEMEIETFVLSRETTTEELRDVFSGWKAVLDAGKQVAIVVKKGALENDDKIRYENDTSVLREEIIRHITAVTGDDPIISTTGKASRELYEIRESSEVGHGRDFLTVGSMGHSSSIALGVALARPDLKVWCIDGDGAAIMHMGALAVNGSSGVKNLVHIVINNGAHESVGGMPTAGSNIRFSEIAGSCGYVSARHVSTLDELDNALKKAKESDELTFIEVECGIGARDDLGRPTTTAMENKKAFMEHLRFTDRA